MLDIISGPWHWSVSGFAIAIVMFLLLYAGKEFGVSSNLRTICSIAGAGKKYNFFDIDWKAQRWNLTFILGAAFGGFLAFHVFPNPEPLSVAPQTVEYLNSIGIDGPKSGIEAYLPAAFFTVDQLFTLRGVMILVLGGFLVGFGTRWAGGCTSGHAISGLSNLQLPSLIAVVGFFIGGLAMSWLILPQIMKI